MIEVRRRRSVPLEPEIAPLVDVVFILLLFFVVTASFADLGISLALPEAETAAAQDPRVLVVSIDADGRVYAGRVEVPLDRLRDVLEQRRAEVPDGELALRADRAAPYGTFVTVLDRARSVGFADVMLATDPRPADPELPPGE